MKRLIPFILATLCGWPTAFAGGGIGYATEPTQILNNLELLDIHHLNYEQLEDMLIQAKLLKTQNFGDVMNQLVQLRRLVNEDFAISYANRHINELFQETYPGYVVERRFSEDYEEWTRSSLDTIRGTLRAAGLQDQDYESEEGFIQWLEGVAANPLGRNQAIQAGIQVSGHQIRQIQKLRQLMMAQTQAQAAYFASQEQKQGRQTAAEALFLEPEEQPDVPYDRMRKYEGFTK